jgi:hypothetical protein
MRRALMSLCAVVAATTAVATGCGGGTDRDGDSRVQHDPRPLPRALTWQQELRVTDAQQRLTRQCMNRHGFTFWENRTLTLRESRPVRYVQDDVAWARSYGYGGRIDAKSEQVRKHHPIAAYRQGLSAERRAPFDVALDGGGGAIELAASLPGSGVEVRKRLGGCTAEAEKTLYGDPAQWFRAAKTATGLNSLYGKDLMNDRRLTTAIRAWSTCMRQAGQPYDNPQAARDTVRRNTASLGRARADEAFAAERRTAVADAECARETSLKSVAAARETYYTDRLRDRYGAEIDTYRHLGQRAYERAVRIVPQRA